MLGSISSEEKRSEIAVCCQCLLCADFFLVAVDAIPPKSSFGKSKKGEAALEELLSKLQDMHCGMAPLSSSKAAEFGSAGAARAHADEEMVMDVYADLVPLTEAQRAAAVEAKAATAAAAAATKKAAAKGGKKAAAKSAKLESVLADRWFSPFAARNGRLPCGAHLYPCPTCAELSTGLPHADYLARIAELPTVLTPCRMYSWGEAEVEAEGGAGGGEGEGGAGPELAPLYMNMQANPSAKPKWTLVQGLGPPALEVDKSRTNRVFKPSLRQFGIADNQGFQRRAEKEGIEIEAAAYALMAEAVHWTVAALSSGGGGGGGGAVGSDSCCSGHPGAGAAALGKAGKKAAGADGGAALVGRWFELAPLFLSWDQVANQMLPAPPPHADGAEREVVVVVCECPFCTRKQHEKQEAQAKAKRAPNKK
jgi:hypothetical protein